MPRLPGPTQVLALVAGGLVAIAALARCSGAYAGARARDQQLADSAAAAAVQHVAVKRRAAVAAGRVFIGTEAPHAEAKAATNRVLERNDAAIATARDVRDAALAAAVDTLRTLPELRLELRRSADQITHLAAALEATRDTVLLERAAAEDRIVAAVAAARAQDALDRAQQELEGARQRQLAVARARPPWWRRALGATCLLATAAGGAGLGSIAGGPSGAMLGAGAGLVGGRLACKRD